MKIILTSLLIAIFFGCTSMTPEEIEEYDKQLIKNRIDEEYDKFYRSTRRNKDEFRDTGAIISDYVNNSKSGLFGRIENQGSFSLAKYKKKIYIKLTFTYDSWAFLDECHEKDYGKLKVEVSDRSTSSGSTGYGKYKSYYSNVHEQLIVEVSSKLLSAAKTKGLNIKCYGKRGASVTTIFNHQVKGFLDKVSELEKINQD